MIYNATQHRRIHPSIKMAQRDKDLLFTSANKIWNNKYLYKIQRATKDDVFRKCAPSCFLILRCMIPMAVALNFKIYFKSDGGELSTQMQQGDQQTMICLIDIPVSQTNKKKSSTNCCLLHNIVYRIWSASRALLTGAPRHKITVILTKIEYFKLKSFNVI